MLLLNDTSFLKLWKVHLLAYDAKVMMTNIMSFKLKVHSINL